MAAFFKIFGVVYGLVAVLGFFAGDQPLLGIIAHNMADMWLHVAIAAVSLYLGFGMKEPAVMERLRALGNEPKPTSPEEFKARMAADIAKWTAVVDGASFERI